MAYILNLITPGATFTLLIKSWDMGYKREQFIEIHGTWLKMLLMHYCKTDSHITQ
jgi:hypothetical protein